MKIWCESCHGHGCDYIPNYDYEENYCGDSEYKCNVCDGNGYVEDLELERLAEIGKSTEMFLESEDIIYDIDNYSDFRRYKVISTTEKLLDWCKLFKK